MTIIQDALALLGCQVTDKITHFEGIVTGIMFDLNGCVLASIAPRIDKDSKRRDSEWFDVKRLQVGESIVQPPKFAHVRMGEEPGPSHLPVDRKLSVP